MKPAPAKVVQSKSDNGSGVAVAGVPEVDDEEDEDEEDEEDEEEEDEEDEEEEDEDEFVESRVIDTPGVCDSSLGGSLALVTLSEKFRTPPPASPWPKKLRPSACSGLPFWSVVLKRKSNTPVLLKPCEPGMIVSGPFVDVVGGVTTPPAGSMSATTCGVVTLVAPAVGGGPVGAAILLVLVKV
jgi:hypothetical protein